MGSSIHRITSYNVCYTKLLRYRLHCKDPKIEAACRRPSCVYPGVCPNLNTDHAPLIQLYRRAREVKGVRKVLIASGVRYDLAIKSPEYVRELRNNFV